MEAENKFSIDNGFKTDSVCHTLSRRKAHNKNTDGKIEGTMQENGRNQTDGLAQSQQNRPYQNYQHLHQIGIHTDRSSIKSPWIDTITSEQTVSYVLRLAPDRNS